MTSRVIRGSGPGQNPSLDPGSDPDSDPADDQATEPTHALERALADVGIACEVEVQGKLAVLLATDDAMARLTDDATRRLAVDLARTMGFTHVAIELCAVPPARESRGGVPESDAPLPRD